ncbi:MAG: hypothetical protein IT229_07605 [Flavobacteriales bacterium]|nr:hypothetical protein [Flavobacteriales bacterium]
MPGILLAIGYAALLLYLIHRSRFFRVIGVPDGWVKSAFVLKVMAGTVLWAVYTYVIVDRPNADIYRYFDDSAVMYSALKTSPGDYLRMLTGIGNDSPHFDALYYRVMNNWYRKYESNMYNDAHTIIRFNALVRLVSFGSIHVHTVFAAFLAYVGSIGLVKAIAGLLPRLVKPLFLVVFVIPSVLFWSSGVIKETFLMFALGLLIWSVFCALDRRVKGLLLLSIIPLATLLFFLKFYVLMSMVPALVAYVWCKLRPERPLLKFAVVHIILLLIAANSERFIPGFDILNTLAWKQKDFIGLAVSVNSGSYIPTPYLEPTFASFAARAPHALYTTFLGPLQAWRNGAMGFASALETSALIVVFGLLLMHRKAWQQVDKVFLLYCISFCVLLALVIGWTTPVMGAVVRYRVPLLPFLLFAALAVTDEERLLRRWRWLRPL